MTDAFPLRWPHGRPRTPANQRKEALFNKKVPTRSGYDTTEKLTIADGLARLQREIDLIGAGDYVLSSNLALRLDGRPRSAQATPDDPGIALYFTLVGKPHCLPCDRYTRPADNIAAIAKHLEATRAIERYGVASIAEMFTGFTALPAPSGKRQWREVLKMEGFEASMTDSDMIEQRYRALAKEAHPDRGGSHEAMAELNAARDEALKEISNG